jgi:HEAT repeat protein
MKAALCIAMLSVLGISTVCWAQVAQDEMHRRAIIHLLDARTGFPTAKQLLRTGKLTVTNRIVSQIAENKREKPRYRLNAIRALEYFPTKRTRIVLMGLLYAKHQKAAYKRTCLKALARAFGPAMYLELLPFLQDADPRVRGGAALAIGEIDDVRGEGILSNHLGHEKELAVRIEIEKGIDQFKKRAVKKRMRLLKKARPLTQDKKGI